MLMGETMRLVRVPAAMAMLVVCVLNASVLRAQLSMDAGVDSTPLAPVVRSTSPNTAAAQSPLAPDSPQRSQLPADLFKPKSGSNKTANHATSSIISDMQSLGGRTADVGSLLHDAAEANGLAAQKRSPLTHDVRIRGTRTGQIIGAGSLWNPGREDLDTALNKIFSYNIAEVHVTKGPYSVRLGPGFNFVDMRLKQAPIADGGTPFGGTTSFDYEANGQNFVGRQYIFGGGDRWGFSANYGHATGNDYEAGNNRGVPSSFKSRDLYTTLGHKISEDQRIDFGYIRLDQSDVEFPGLVYDINFLVTDGFEAEYIDTGRDHGILQAEAWYNRTRFEGDSQRPGKLAQIPDLASEFMEPNLETDVDGSSLGYRIFETRDVRFGEWTYGTDLVYLDTTLNDREVAGPGAGHNYPIPHSNSIDVGVFTDVRSPVSDRVVVNAGTRLDFASYRSSEFVPGTPGPIDQLKDAPLDRTFDLWAAYISGEYASTDCLTWSLGLGAAQRAPTFTELYAVESFIGTLQRGLTFVSGDPLLRPERLRQIDVAVRWESSHTRLRLAGFHSWIEDYITYDLTIPTVRRGGLSTGVAYVNTDLATLAGFEFDAERDLTPSMQLFNRISFVEGRDHSRIKPSRQGGLFRSGSMVPEEPLPGIPPLEARVGIRLRDPSPQALWNIEFTGRFVDRQDRVARTLLERPTRSFATADLRSFWQLTDRVGVFLGVENIADRTYREHLDYRVGKGLLRRGRSWYIGTDFRF